VTRTRNSNPPPTCTIDGCDRPYDASGWCKGHRLRNHRHGDPLAGGVGRNHDRPDTCTVTDCQQPVAKRTWCNAHYIRWRRHGDPTAGDRMRANDPGTCVVCGRKAVAREHCKTHLKHLYGDRRSRVPMKVRKQRWAMWRNSCYLCGGPAEASDHVIPRAKGGLDVPANLRPICTACNTRKRDHWHGIAWLQEQVTR